MRRRVILIPLLLLLLLSLAGCSASATPSSTPPTGVQQETPAQQEPAVQQEAVAPQDAASEPAAAPAEPTADTPEQQATVYVTDTGTKYHMDGCRHIRKSRSPISLEDAKAQDYGPCSTCNPPS
jgi:micrococcal nuclease